jgi:6-phosphogluconolactonase/glucosamine-6-phosphate isomerase/deaminase
MKINRFSSKEEAAASAGEALTQMLTDYRKAPLLLMLSGGTALAMLEYVGTGSLGENLTISVLDERFAPLEAHNQVAAAASAGPPLTGRSEDPQINPVRNRPAEGTATAAQGRLVSNGVNNFSQLQKTDFYKTAFDAGCSFFGTSLRPGESPLQLQQRWEHNLRAWQIENPNGKIFATLGMGQDGHTAGIFPFAENAKKFKQLFQVDNWTVAFDAQGKSRYLKRITTTLHFFALIDHAIAFVCGAEKQAKLEQVLAKQGKINELPALGWHKIKKVDVYTDIK